MREQAPGEHRVALVPELAARLVAGGFSVTVQSGAGAGAQVPDEAYSAAGAEVLPDALAGADVVLGVGPLPAEELRRVAPGTLTISFLPFLAPALRARRDGGLSALAMNLIPRISRAQPMDAVTSQALVAGYRGVLVAAERLPRFLPGMVTAAGTLPPARVLVLGTGVAGLSAITTARRLGAEVFAHDVRPSSATEAASVGAQFLDLDLAPLPEPEAYLRRMTERQVARLRDRLAPHVAAADAVITTAAVPGQAGPPRLISRAMVSAMRPGSVVVDLSADLGGNVEGVRAGEETRVGGVLLWGGRNVAAQVPLHASRLYAANVVALLEHVAGTRTGSGIDLTDEIVDACCVTFGGQVRPPWASLLAELEGPGG